MQVSQEFEKKCDRYEMYLANHEGKHPVMVTENAGECADIEANKHACWRYRISKLKKNGKLSPTRILRLERIKGFFDSVRHTFEEQCERWSLFAAKFHRAPADLHRRAQTTKLLKREAKLGRWASNILDRFKHGNLRLDEYRALDALPQWNWGAYGREFTSWCRRWRLWCTENQRMPAVTTGALEEEKQLASWHNRMLCKLIKATPTDPRHLTRVPYWTAELTKLPYWTWDLTGNSLDLNSEK
jgi:hypothetical protein